MTNKSLIQLLHIEQNNSQPLYVLFCKNLDFEECKISIEYHNTTSDTLDVAPPSPLQVVWTILTCTLLTPLIHTQPSQMI